MGTPTTYVLYFIWHFQLNLNSLNILDTFETALVINILKIFNIQNPRLLDALNVVNVISMNITDLKQYSYSSLVNLFKFDSTK